MRKKSYILRFLSAVVEHWLALVGGSLVAIVLFTVLPAVGVELPKTVLVATLSLAVFWACYLAWTDTAKTLDDLQERMQPKLKASCGINIAQSRVLTKFNTGPRAYYLRLVLDADGIASVPNCCGCLTRITKDGSVRMGNETLYLKFAHGDDPPKESRKTIRAGISAHLDVLAAVENNTVIVTTAGWEFPNSIDPNGLIRELGEYILTVLVAGDDTTPLEATLRFNWTGNWETADLQLIKAVAFSHWLSPQQPNLLRGQKLTIGQATSD